MLIFQFEIKLCENSIILDVVVIKWDFIDEQETSTWIVKQMNESFGWLRDSLVFFCATAYFVTGKCVFVVYIKPPSMYSNRLVCVWVVSIAYSLNNGLFLIHITCQPIDSSPYCRGRVRVSRDIYPLPCFLFLIYSTSIWDENVIFTVEFANKVVMLTMMFWKILYFACKWRCFDNNFILF